MEKTKLIIENGDTINCLFNPKDYTVTKTNNWKAEAKQGATAQQPQFTGGLPWEMTLQLLFDSSLLKPEISVKQATAQLFDAMKATVGEGGKGNTKRPPKITFKYGEFEFEAVAKNLSVQYTLFTSKGEPIRADVKLALMQWTVDPGKGQNPTTHGEGGVGAHLVRDGDSLPSIAYQLYGDATQWRTIAQANGIDDPLRVRSGTTLSVPRLDA